MNLPTAVRIGETMAALRNAFDPWFYGKPVAGETRRLGDDRQSVAGHIISPVLTIERALACSLN
jgi:hypothetical protein